MTKYDPYKGMRPYRGRRNRLTKGQRQKGGTVAALGVGAFMFRQFQRNSAAGGGTTGGELSRVEFSQPAATNLSVMALYVAPGGEYALDGSLDSTNPLHISAHLSRSEPSHTVRVVPVINGEQELSIAVVSTTDVNGVASITFGADDMSNIAADNRTTVRFKFVVDGDYTNPVMVDCPIGA